MQNALIAFVATLIIGVVGIATAWWQGADLSFRVYKRIFGILLAAALVVGGVTYFAS